jgi:hypothetical protein
VVGLPVIYTFTWDLVMHSQSSFCRWSMTRRDFLKSGVAALAGPAVFDLARVASASTPYAGRGVLVLDNCDPWQRGKEEGDNNLSCYDLAGRLVFRVSGLNVCEEIGSPHKIAVDVKARRIWLTENVGHRLLQYDFAGKELLSLPDIQASALAVDPATGHVWVLRSTGRIGGSSLEVYDRKGERQASHPHHGWDISYDRTSRTFWLAAEELIKVDPDGKTLVQKRITRWCSSSLAVDQRTGNVWVTTRKHPQAGGENALMAFDSDGLEVHNIDLGERSPFRVAVDSDNGMVWVAIFGGPVLHFTRRGDAEGELDVKSLALEVEGYTGEAWVATKDEVLRLNHKGTVLRKAQHKRDTSQVWIATF